MIYFVILSFGLTLFYYFKIVAEPLHPDSGEFLYAGMIRRKGFRKEYLQRKTGKGYHSASLSYDAFPPPPFSSLTKQKEYIGAFPTFRDKMFVWWFFEIIIQWLPLKPKQFRIINCLLIFVITNLFFTLLQSYIILPHAILWGMIFQMVLMLPHFDFYQIHAEEWGVLLLLVELHLLSASEVHLLLPIIFGIVLVFIFFFIKITFAPTLLYFFLSPMIIFQKPVFFNIAAFSAIIFLIYLVIYWTLTKTLKPVFWSINPFHLLKYKKTASTTLNTNQMEKPFSLRQFFKNYRLELITGLIFLVPFIQWIFSTIPGTKMELFMVGWLFVSLTEVLIQGKLYPSHLLPLTIPGIFFIALQSGIMQLPFALIILFIWSKYFIYNPQSLLETYGRQSQNPFVSAMLNYDQVAEYVKKQTEAADSILAIGYCSPVYVLANRRGALGLYEALITLEPADIGKKLGEGWEWWLLQAIAKMKPKLVIDSSHRLNPWELEKALGINLEKIEAIGNYNIYAANYADSLKYPANMGDKIFR